MWNDQKKIGIQIKKINGPNELESLQKHMMAPNNYAYDHGFIDFLKCKKCDGKYKLRNGKFGLFYGCSNFPKCKSTNSIADFTYDILLENGIAIYELEIECWKCHKPIKIISYFPYFDFCTIDPDLLKIDKLSIIRLSVLEKVDEKLQNDYIHVKKTYSKKAGYSYVANTCQHCGALQGSTISLQNVFEKLNEAFKMKGVNQYITKRLVIDENVLSREEWRQVVNELMKR